MTNEVKKLKKIAKATQADVRPLVYDDVRSEKFSCRTSSSRFEVES